MVRYTEPRLEILYFDEDEIICGVSAARYADEQLAETFFKTNKASLTTSINVSEVQVTVE